MNIHDYNKIVIVGSGGSGKSWLGRRLGEITGYPLYHLDKEFWTPNWEMLSKAERLPKQQEMISGERWIIEGNYRSTMEQRFPAADLVIFLDINRFVCMVSALRRYGRKRPELPGYKVEKKIFGKDGQVTLFKWIWGYPKTDVGKKNVMALHEKHSDIAFWQICSRRKIKRLLREWENKIPPAPSGHPPFLASAEAKGGKPSSVNRDKTFLSG